MKISWVHSWGVCIAKDRLAREKRVDLPRAAPHSMRILGHEDWKNRDLVGAKPWIQSQRHSAGRGSAKRNGETRVFSRLCLWKRRAVIESETEHREYEFTAVNGRIPGEILFNSLCIPVQVGGAGTTARSYGFQRQVKHLFMVCLDRVARERRGWPSCSSVFQCQAQCFWQCVIHSASG